MSFSPEKLAIASTIMGAAIGIISSLVITIFWHIVTECNLKTKKVLIPILYVLSIFVLLYFILRLWGIYVSIKDPISLEQIYLVS